MSALDEKVDRLESLTQSQHRELEGRLSDSERREWMPRVHQVHISPPVGDDTDELVIRNAPFETDDQFPGMFGVHLDLRGVLYYRGFRVRFGVDQNSTATTGVSCAVYSVLNKDAFEKDDPNAKDIRLKLVADLGSVVQVVTRTDEDQGFHLGEHSVFRDHVVDPRLGEYFLLFQALSGTSIAASRVNNVVNPAHRFVSEGVKKDATGALVNNPSKFGEWPDNVRWKETVNQTPIIALLSGYGLRFWRTS